MPSNTHPAQNIRSAAAADAASADRKQYAVIMFKGVNGSPRKLWFDDPIEALGMAVEYLKAGYQVRLSDGAVVWFADRPKANGDGGALAHLLGPANIGGHK